MAVALDITVRFHFASEVQKGGMKTDKGCFEMEQQGRAAQESVQDMTEIERLVSGMKRSGGG